MKTLPYLLHGNCRRSIFLQIQAAIVSCLLVCTSAVLMAQAGDVPTVHPGGQSGMATAGAEPATFDSQHRPITAGGFSKTGPIVFIDATKQSGLAGWRNVTGTPEKKLIIEAKG